VLPLTARDAAIEERTVSNPYDPNRPENPGTSGGQYPPQQYPPQQYPQYPEQQQPGYPAYPQYPGGQQYYGQPGQYGTPVMPPPMPPKKSNKTLWIVLGTVGGVLLLACVGCVGVLAYLGSQAANNPLIGSTLAATSFCVDEQGQEYTKAYQLLSPSLQGQMTEDQFVQASQAHDTADGKIETCEAVQGGDSSVTNTSASVEVTVTRTGGTTTTGNITLVNAGGAWKVDSIDPALSLT
jgi:hypothetical protein